jgi:hypothetical protein
LTSARNRVRASGACSPSKVTSNRRPLSISKLTRIRFESSCSDGIDEALRSRGDILAVAGRPVHLAINAALALAIFGSKSFKRGVNSSISDDDPTCPIRSINARRVSRDVSHRSAVMRTSAPVSAVTSAGVGVAFSSVTAAVRMTS